MAETPAIGSVGEWRSLNPAVTVTEPLNSNSTVSNLQVGENLFVWEMSSIFISLFYLYIVFSLCTNVPLHSNKQI